MWGNDTLANLIASVLFVATLLCVSFCADPAKADQPAAPAGGSLPGAAPVSPGHPNFPNGYELDAYLDCGAIEEVIGASGARITQTRGKSRSSTGPTGPLADVAYDEERVEFLISNLDVAADYVLGFTWWDADGLDRRESLRFGVGDPVAWTTVMPSTKPLAFHGDEPTWARVLLPLRGSRIQAGAVRVAFVNDAGPDAVVSELWLLKRKETGAQKRVLIVTGDDWSGHHWRETGPELAQILREDPRLEVSITEAPAILGSPLLDQYDAVIIHFKNYSQRLPLGNEVWTEFERYVNAGHGVVIVHFGCGAFEDWDGFVTIAGRVWNPEKRAHDPYGPFQVRVVDPGHPITAGMTTFDVQDELYTCLDGAPPIRVLCCATSRVDQQDCPMGFVVPGGGGIFHCTLGHDVAALRSPGTRDLYRRAAAWAAGLVPADSSTDTR